MGCGASQIAAIAAEQAGVQLIVPGEQGTFAPHSEESLVCLDVMVGDHKADGKKTERQ